MQRIRLLTLALIILGACALGCGEGPKREEGKDPFKARQETVKEKKQDSFMKPRIPGGPKGQ
jgi:outer membrane biogenesis lipoprotein LolB